MGRASDIRGGGCIPVIAVLLALCALVTGGVALLLDVSDVWFHATIMMLVASALAGLGARLGPFRHGWSVVFDGDGVYAQQILGPHSHEGRVPWSELVEVGIVTSNCGRAPTDFHWVLLGENDGCVVPLGLAKDVGLFTALTKLPGFDHDAVVDACCSTTNAVFRCWRGERATHGLRQRRSLRDPEVQPILGSGGTTRWDDALAAYREATPSPVTEG